ncbi:MAG: zf-HC2 domain-containing protein [Brachyspira sp.]|jgi:hypothetical protein|nr:zf-HC2 domain-containing protein [Brachyspira sp.]CCY25318.1 unknown [Brachyspira sp. CAG:484]
MHELTCNQVITLLTFYIENKLNKNLSRQISEHLAICPKCMEKYQKLRKILENFSEIKSRISEDELEVDASIYETPQYEKFKANLSAYIDNELSDSDNIKIKKIAISNPLARRDLENIYAFKQLLQTSFNRTKNELKQDYSRKTLEKLYQTKNETKIPQFYKLAGIFMCILLFMLIGILNMLNF